MGGEKKGVEGARLRKFHVLPGIPFVAIMSLKLSALCF